MEEDKPPDIYHLLSDLAEDNRDFEEQWKDIYSDCNHLYEIRLDFPEFFDDISRISLEDRQHAAMCGQQILNSLVEKFTKLIGLVPSHVRKRQIKEWLKELHKNVDDAPINFLEQIKEKLHQEVQIYSTFTGISSSCLPVVTKERLLNQTETPFIINELGSSVMQYSSCSSFATETHTPSETSEGSAAVKEYASLREEERTNLQERPGVCIIIDQIYIPEDVKILRELFTDLGYETKQIGPEEVKISTQVIHDYLMTDTTVHDRSAVVIVLDVAYEDMDDDINSYQHSFDGCDKLEDKPKILITHLYDGNPVKLQRPPDGILHILSKISDDDTGDSLFIKALDAVFRKHYRTCDIYELLTQVLRDVEIPQHIKLKDVEYRQGKYPHQSVIFKSSLKSPFRIGKTHTDIPDGSTGLFSSLPTQHKRLERISKYDLKKVFSVDIDLKLTSAVYKQHYRMDRKPRGLCVIVNMSNDRPGSLVDEVKMAQLFEELYFDVRQISNRTHEEIEQEITALSSNISDLHQCVVVFIMGHGTTLGKVHYFADVTYTQQSSDYVLDVFKNQKHLIGKPKIFIIQTCFGGKTMGGLSAVAMETDVVANEDALSLKIKAEEPFAVHKDSDTIKLNATIEEYSSFRMSLDGSYLIQGVDKILREYSAEKDVTQLMTLIKNNVLRLGKERESLQQAKVVDIQNLHLYLNPGHSVAEQIQLPDLSPCKRLCVEGSVVWNGKGRVAYVADRCNTWIKLVNIDTAETQVYVPQNPGDMYGILSGVSVSGRDDNYPNEHVITVKHLSGNISVLFVRLNEKEWQKLSNLFPTVTSSISERSRIEERNEGLYNRKPAEAPRAPWLQAYEPLTLCSVNNDAIAILWGRRGSSKSMIHVYSCDNIHHSDIGKANARLTLKCKTKSEDSGKFCLGIRDKMCYSNTKFYISCFSSSTVFKLDSQGNIEIMLGNAAFSPGMKTPGSLYKPCGLFTNRRYNSERIIIACFDGIHQVTIIQSNDGTWKEEWSSDILPLDRSNGMCYYNDVILTITDCGLEYSSLLFVSNLEDTSSISLTPNYSKRFKSQLVQTLWPTLDPDIVAVGSAESAHIFLVRSDGELLGTQFINMEARIMSGIHLYRNIHLIIARDKNRSYIFCVKFTMKDDENNPDFCGEQGLDGTTNSDIQYIGCKEENANYQPISVLNVNGDQYGLFCRRRSTIDFEYIAVLELYNRTEKKYMKSVILDVVDVGINDRMVVDRNGLIIVSSYVKNLLYTFDVDGTLIAVLDTAGLNPCSIMVDEKNYFLVQCQNCLYRCAHNTKVDCASSLSDWETVIDRPSWDVCYSGDNVYTVYKHTLNVYKTDNVYHESSLLRPILNPDKKNPPLMPLADKAAIQEGDQIQKYHYPPMWPGESLRSITLDQCIDIDFKPRTCWSCGDNDTIIVGGCNEQGQPTLSVVSATGRCITHMLSYGREIISGLLVKMWLHIVCVANDRWYITSSNKINLIKLDPTSTDSSIIQPLLTLNVTNPVHVFRKSLQLFGVFCLNDIYTHGTISLLGLDQLILPFATDPHTLQSTALWGTRTLIHLNLPKPHPSDKLAVTPRGQYCIASCWRDEIRVYSCTGGYRYTIGKQRNNTLHLGELSFPRSLHCTADYRLVIVGLYGDIQIYNMSSETGTQVKTKYTIQNDDEQYCSYTMCCWKRKHKSTKENDNNDAIYEKDGRRHVYYLKHDPVGWKIVRGENLEIRVLYSIVTNTKIWDIESDIITGNWRIALYNLQKL